MSPVIRPFPIAPARTTGEMPSFSDDPLGNERWWIKRNSPGVFLGTKPIGETRQTGKGGEENGPASLWAASSLLIFASTAAGFCKADKRLGAWLEKRGPSKCKGKPSVNPAVKNSTIEWVYPERKNNKRSIFTGVGN